MNIRAIQQSLRVVSAAVLLFIVGAGTANALDRDPFLRADVKEALHLHDTCIAGGTEEVRAAEVALQRWIEREPSDALARVYMGSLLTIKSSKAWIGPQKLRYLKEGVRMMDAAVEAAPDRPEVRFVRGVNSHQLPGFCGRRKTALDDFRILIEQLRDPNSRAAGFSAETRQAIYYYAGLVFQRADDVSLAREVWQTGLALAEHTEIANKIREQLGKLGPS
jgi:hypothetical protein